MTNWETYLTYDWFRDIWLPAAGAILIPVAIAFFTWWFGSSRAEKQREIQELREDLNFLVSVCLASINGLKFLSEKLKEIEPKEKITIDLIVNNIPSPTDLNFDDICYGFLFDNVFATVNEAKYKNCISYNTDFIVDIVRVKSLLSSTEQYVSHRNSVIKSLAECEDFNTKLQRCFAFLTNDYKNLRLFLIDVYRITILVKIIISHVVKLNQEIKGLKLTPQLYNQEQMDFIKIAEEEYTKYSAQKQESQNA